MSGKDQRPAPRVPVTLFIGKADDSIPLGRSRDMSVSGIFVETSHRPDLESVHEIWFVWGEEIFAARARVVRHAEDGVGLTFIDPDAGFVQSIKEITGVSEHPIPDLSED